MKNKILNFHATKKGKFLLFVLLVLLVLNFFDKERVFYLPFNIPGNLKASTIPPLGIFIESQYKNEKINYRSVLTHERVHWKQYKRMGLFSFYFNYFKIYLKSGRINNWMEEEARMPLKTGKME